MAVQGDSHTFDRSFFIESLFFYLILFQIVFALKRIIKKKIVVEVRMLEDTIFFVLFFRYFFFFGLFSFAKKKDTHREYFNLGVKSTVIIIITMVILPRITLFFKKFQQNSRKFKLRISKL